MKNLALGVFAMAGLMYCLKLGFEVESSYYMRAHRTTFMYSLSGVESGAISHQPKYVAVKATLGQKWTPPVQPPANHPPLRIVIGAHTWRVRFTTPEYLRATDSLAYSSIETSTIWLCNRANSIEMRDSLVHEIMHAARYENGGGYVEDKWDDEEKFINPTAPILAQVLHDNPKLVSWLGER